MDDILSQIIAYAPDKIDTETKARAMVQGPRNMKLAQVPRSEMDNFNTPDLDQGADSILKPGETLEDDFDVEFRRPNAQGGAAKQLLAQPSVDGSRPGYATSTVKTKKFKYPISNQFGAFYSDKKPKVSKKIIVQDEKTKFINKLVSDANSGDKHVSIGEIGEKVKKKFKLKNVKSVNITSFPSLNLLESRADKIDKVLRDMLISDKPLNGFWHNVISEKTGVPINKPGNLRILEQSPAYNSIKDQGLDLLKINYSRKSFNYLHDFSLSDQLTKALEISKGNPTYIGLGGEKVRTALPSNKIMEFALRSWNNNKGSKTGPIQFFKNGKPIVWEKGIKLPYSDVSFSYNGKMHKKSNLNTDYMKKFFPEVYNNQIAINNLSVKKIDNPLKPESKISVKDLIKKIQVDSYGWQPRFPTLEIIHGKKGVISEPFSNLTYGTRDLNQLENAVRTSMKAGNIKPREGNQLIKDIYSSIQNKTGADLDQSIIDRQVDLAKNKNLTYPRIKEVGVEQFKTMLADLGCPKSLQKASGGRIKYSKGTTCSIKGRDILEKGLKNGFKKSDVGLAQKILGSGKFLKEAVSLRGLFGPAALAFTVAAEAGIVGYDMLATGKSFKEAIGSSLFNYALGDKTKIDSDEEFMKRLKNIKVGPQGYQRMGDAEIGKMLNFKANLDDMKRGFDLYGELDAITKNRKQIGSNPEDAFNENAFQLDSDKQEDAVRADIRDYNKTGTPRRVTDYLLSDKAKEGADATAYANLLVKEDQLKNAGTGDALPKVDQGIARNLKQTKYDIDNLFNPKKLDEFGQMFMNATPGEQSYFMGRTDFMEGGIASLNVNKK